MEYQVRFVPGELMPDSKRWGLCRNPKTDTVTLAISDEMLGEDRREIERMLEAAWAAYRDMAARPLSAAS